MHKETPKYIFNEYIASDGSFDFIGYLERKRISDMLTLREKTNEEPIEKVIDKISEDFARNLGARLKELLANKAIVLRSRGTKE